MQIAEALSRGKKILGGEDEKLSKALYRARFFEIELLLSHFMGISREKIFAHPEMEVPAGVLRKFRLGCKNLAAGMPLAYITRRREFFGLSFYVDERVLIPRPETEHLVEEVLSLLSLRAKRSILRQAQDDNTKSVMVSLSNRASGAVPAMTSPRILDLGTGSGCIAIALAKKVASARITATDISVDALAVARKNARAHGVTSRITFLKSDLLKSFLAGESISQFLPVEKSRRLSLAQNSAIFLPREKFRRLPQAKKSSKILPREDFLTGSAQHFPENAPVPAFDIIVANLPYIPRAETAIVEKNVKKYEPAQALWAGRDGLYFLRRFLLQLRLMPKLPRVVVCEFGFSMKRAVSQLIKNLFPKKRVVFKKDLAGLDRLFILYLS